MILLGRVLGIVKLGVFKFIGNYGVFDSS